MDPQLIDIAKRFLFVLTVISIVGAVLDSSGRLPGLVLTFIQLLLIFYMAAKMSMSANASVLISGAAGALLSSIAGITYSVAYWLSLPFFNETRLSAFYFVGTMFVDSMISAVIMAFLGFFVGLIGGFIGQRALEKRMS